MKILIVEDNELQRRIITEFVRDQVDEFVECSDGSGALASYSHHRPDVVLMDLQMTKVDGLEATRKIKKVFSDARIIIVSQWDTPALRKAAGESGAEEYVNKNDLLPLRELLKVK